MIAIRVFERDDDHGLKFGGLSKETPMTTGPGVGSTPPLSVPPDWSRWAACIDRYDLEWIDPDPEQARRCCAICLGCPVRQQCLTAALTAAEPWGIWGGLDPSQRSDLARAAGLPAPAVLPMHGFRARYVKHGCRCAACRYANTNYIRELRRKASAA
jgi:hypothetical protein